MAKRAVVLFLFFLLAVGTGLGQVPQPYVYGGLSLNGSGYYPASGAAGTGMNLETTHVLAGAEIWAGNAHKQDSGTGYEIGGQARSFVARTGNLYFGAGAQRSKLTTSILFETGDGAQPSAEEKISCAKLLRAGTANVRAAGYRTA